MIDKSKEEELNEILKFIDDGLRERKRKGLKPDITNFETGE